MKKSFLTSFVLILIFTVVTVFSGCSKNVGRSSVSTDGVLSNGGTVLTYDNFLYFINGKNDDVDDNTWGKVEKGGVYRIAINDDGGFKSDSEPEIVVSQNVSDAYCSIHIFGDYLYYVTNSTSKDSSGEIISGIYDFCRIKLDGTKRQTLYTTKTKDDKLDYAYYVAGEDTLYLCVYETENATITSIDIGKRPQTKIIVNDVVTVMFSETQGERAEINSYIYFTQSPSKNSSEKSGNVVKRILPTGKQESTISLSRTISLLSIRGNALIYSDGTDVFKTTNINALASNDERMSYGTQENVIFEENYIVYLDSNSNIRKTSWANGLLTSTLITTISGEDSKVEFIGIDGSELFYLEDSILMKIELQANGKTTKLCSDEIEAQDTELVIELIGDYVYFFKSNTTDIEDDEDTDEDESDSVVCTYMYRVNINGEDVDKPIFVGYKISGDIIEE